MKYFVAGHVWLLVALFMVLGRRVDGDTCSFFGAGAWLNAVTYDLLTLVCAVVGVASLIGLPAFRYFDAKLSAFDDKFPDKSGEKPAEEQDSGGIVL